MVDRKTSAKSSPAASRAAAKPEPCAEPDATAPGPGDAKPAAKSIILFSDGTGNSSAKLFKTNVWRLYEALDLGPPAGSRTQVQIAYYDNGVGTSQFRPLALLGGIFGFGLKRNILAIYRFLCRNYKPGDKIYVFGFSRGAFTIRLLMGLIAQEGVVEYRDENQLAYHSRDAYREFCRNQWPNRWPAKLFARLLRFIRDLLLRGKRALFRQTPYADVRKFPADIEFAGLWDTVAAYGGPSVEITRGIDDWIWPLTMANYELSPKVKKACHALCLDDRRDAFQPLLFDEVRELDIVANGRNVVVRLDDDGQPVWETIKPAADRLVQVWFTGMHADVGGGYPDETLSYVSLAWIIGETDLALLDIHRHRIEKMANDYGPVHNSRAGLASYYRYQPRKLEAMLHPLKPHAWTNRIMRDPELERDNFPDHGLLTEVKVHKSVLTRIRTGTDGYAPINLPADYVIYPTDPAMHPKEGSGPPCLASRPGTSQAWGRVWDLVWWRRIFYFLTTLTTLWLFAMPIWANYVPRLRICEDARCWGRSAFGLLDYVLPGFASPWTSAFSANFSWTLALIAAILLFWAIGAWLESSIADRARAIWRGAAPAPRRYSPLQRMRESRAYQYVGFAVKWYLLPLAAALITIGAVLIALTTISAQTHLYFAEQGMAGLRALCETGAESSAPGKTPGGRDFDIRSMCTPLGVNVVQNGHYVVYLQVLPRPQPDHPERDPYLWWDSGYGMTPDRPGTGMPFWLNGFAGMRRAAAQPWLQPLIEIRSPSESGGNPIYVDALHFNSAGGCMHMYRAEFEAARSGALSIFVNDAVLPGNLTFFYENNVGAARVFVLEHDADVGAPPGCISPAAAAPSAGGAGRQAPAAPAAPGVR
jgi:uncharacterized protein (DUF2235 family)